LDVKSKLNAKHNQKMQRMTWKKLEKYSGKNAKIPEKTAFSPEKTLQTETETETETKTQGQNARARAKGDRFSEFWEKYPKKTNAFAASEEWVRLSLDDETVDELMASLDAWALSAQWSEPRYIPNPSTWLKNRRWMDESPPQQGSAQTQGQRDVARMLAELSLPDG
jgi:hypothetical protein